MKGCKSANRNDLIAYCASNLWSCPTVTKWDNFFEKASSVFFKFEQIEQIFRWLFFVALSQAADFLLMVFADCIKKKNQIIGNNSNQELIYNPPKKLTFQGSGIEVPHRQSHTAKRKQNNKCWYVTHFVHQLLTV